MNRVYGVAATLLLFACGPYVGNGELLDGGECAEEHAPVQTPEGTKCFSNALRSCCECLAREACVSDQASCDQSFLDNELPTLLPGRESCLEELGECWDSCTGRA